MLQTIKEKVHAFMSSRADNAIDRHQIIVYLLHSVIVVSVIMMHFAGVIGSHDTLPRLMSVIHLATCLVALWLYLARKISVPVAFSLVALVAQLSIVGRFVFFACTKPDSFLYLILINQMISILLVVFLVMCFVRYTPSVITLISLAAYGGVAAYLKDPNLWSFFGFFFAIEVLFCILGELLHRNVSDMKKDNINLHEYTTAMMHAVRLNKQEIDAYLRICNADHIKLKDTKRLFSILSPRAHSNLISAIREHMMDQLLDVDGLAKIFPMLTKTEREVCGLILQGKSMLKIGQMLDKTEKNIGVVRTHIRKKMNVPHNGDLKRHLMEYMVKNQ